MIARRSPHPERVKTSSKRKPRPGFTLIEVVAVLAVIALLIALLLPATRSARPAARRTQCKNHLKQIGLALHNYHDVYGAFPPAYTVDADGKPLHSWRTLILPWLDQAPLYNKINLSKPWDDPANDEAFQTHLSAYACPSANCPQKHCTYLAVVTSNSCFCATQPRKLSEITDGTGSTMMVIEVPHDQAVHWMAPRDADENLLLSFGPKSKESHTGGRQILLADGAVRFLAQTLDPQTLLALCTATGGESVGEF